MEEIPGIFYLSQVYNFHYICFTLLAILWNGFALAPSY